MVRTGCREMEWNRSKYIVSTDSEFRNHTFLLFITFLLMCLCHPFFSCSPCSQNLLHIFSSIHLSFLPYFSPFFIFYLNSFFDYSLLIYLYYFFVFFLFHFLLFSETNRSFFYFYFLFFYFYSYILFFFFFFFLNMQCIRYRS